MITQPKGTPRTKAHWFRSMSANMQKVYVEKHPKTRFKATAGAIRPTHDEFGHKFGPRYRGNYTLEGRHRHLKEVHGIHSSHLRNILIHHHIQHRKHKEAMYKHMEAARKHKEGSRWNKYHLKKARAAMTKSDKHAAKYNGHIQKYHDKIGNQPYKVKK